MEFVKVKSFNRRGLPTINVNKSGVMRLSPLVKDTLKLKAGDKIGFYHEKDNPKNWCMKINDDDIELRKVHKALLASSASVANEILKSFDFVNSVLIRVALKPIEGDYYALLTSSAKGE